MADEMNRPQGNTTIQRNPSQVPSSGIGARPGVSSESVGANPQNLNQSPSPLGDGIQSSQSERTAAGLDQPINQPGQQRVNAAERRERSEQPRPEGKGGIRPGIIQSPGEVLPSEASTALINAAEIARRDKAEAERAAEFGHLPQSTLDEMDAGKEALKRHQHRAAAPVDANKA
jgi:hypothetical protein